MLTSLINALSKRLLPNSILPVSGLLTLWMVSAVELGSLFALGGGLMVASVCCFIVDVLMAMGAIPVVGVFFPIGVIAALP